MQAFNCRSQELQQERRPSYSKKSSVSKLFQRFSRCCVQTTEQTNEVVLVVAFLLLRIRQLLQDSVILRRPQSVSVNVFDCQRELYILITYNKDKTKRITRGRFRKL
jgi:hypothetical protein